MRPFLLAAVAAALVSGACTSGPPPPVDTQAYVKQITEARAIKDRAFRDEPEPIPADKRAVLLPLRYYAPDPSYTAPAELKLADQRPVFEMPTSTGKLRRMERVGVLEFSLKGQPMSLAAFVEEGQALENLFVPFADLTTGKETYPAGRYLDIRPTSTGFYNIDFNAAYNPTCAYNATYDCPYPPASNRLKVEILAGEKAPRYVTSALQAVIFDFDGVIADSEPLHFRAFQQALAEDGLELSPKEYYARYLGYDDVGMFQAFGEDRGLPMSAGRVTELVARKGARLQSMLTGGSVLFPGAIDFVRAAANAVPIAIASGALRHEIEEVIEAAGVASLFAAIVASGDTPESKPSPAPYRLAFERLQDAAGTALEPRRCVAIEDSRWGLESARGAGLRCVGVTNSYPADELLGAELVVSGLQALTIDALERLCGDGPRSARSETLPGAR